MLQYEELSKSEREKFGPVPAAIGARIKKKKERKKYQVSSVNKRPMRAYFSVAFNTFYFWIYMVRSSKIISNELGP